MTNKLSKAITTNMLKVRLFTEDDARVKEDAEQLGKSQAQVIRDIVHEYYFFKQDPRKAAREDIDKWNTIISEKSIDAINLLDMLHRFTTLPNNTTALVVVSMTVKSLIDKLITVNNLTTYSIDTNICGKGYDTIIFYLPKTYLVTEEQRSRFNVRFNTRGNNIIDIRY